MCYSRGFAMLLHTAGKWDGSAWRRETVFLLPPTLTSSKGSAPFSEDLARFPSSLVCLLEYPAHPLGRDAEGWMGSRRLGRDGTLNEGFPLGPSHGCPSVIASHSRCPDVITPIIAPGILRIIQPNTCTYRGCIQSPPWVQRPTSSPRPSSSCPRSPVKWRMMPSAPAPP